MHPSGGTLTSVGSGFLRGEVVSLPCHLLGSLANALGAAVSSSCWKVLRECEGRAYPGPAAACYLWEHPCTPSPDASTVLASPLHMPPRDAACVGRCPAGYKFTAYFPHPELSRPLSGPTWGLWNGGFLSHGKAARVRGPGGRGVGRARVVQ